MNKIDSYRWDTNYQLEVFNKNVVAKLKMCNNTEKFKKVFNDDIITEFKKKLSNKDYIRMKNDVQIHQDDDVQDYDAWRNSLGGFAKYIEKNT